MAMPEDAAKAEIESLRKRLHRERMARAQSELIAEKSIRELYDRDRELDLLRAVAIASNQAIGYADALQTTLDQVCAHTGWPVGHALLLEEGRTDKLVTTKLWHLDDPQRYQTFRTVTETFSFSLGVGLPGRTLASAKPAWIVDVRKDPNFPRAKLASDIGVRAGFGFPILVGVQVVGVLEFFSTESVEPNASLLDLMAQVGTQLGRVIERNHSEKELLSALERARESDRLKSSFVANMSHEIRTPLNVILGYTDVVAEELGEDAGPEMTSHLNAIRRGGHRLLDTIQKILDFSKIAAGSFVLLPEPVSLVAQLQRTIREQEAIGRQKGLSVSCRVEVAPGTSILFDQHCLSSALTNLINNAIKFTEAGSVSVRLFRGIDGRLCIEVRDTGLGIDPSYLNVLFEPFSQERSGYTRQFEGTGLGLALTKSYLVLNGANLAAVSEKNRGSVFTIEFPIACEIDADGQDLRPSHLHKVLPSGSVAPYALVVEDDPDSQELMKTLLGGHYPVLLASSADEARSKLEPAPQTVGFILMDISLRGSEDGLALTRRLREDQRFQKTPIIALTAHAMSGSRRQANLAGCNAYLTKPVDRSELFATIERLIGVE